MAHYPIDRSDTPIRLFKSDFLEFFTHISPIAVIIVWVPFAVFMMVRGVLFRPAQASWADVSQIHVRSGTFFSYDQFQ